RLEHLFTELRQDTSREFGACIAYATSLCPEEEVELDAAIYETASKQNHGMVTSHKTVVVGSERTLWAGDDVVTGGHFIIAKQHLPIIFNTNEVEDGLYWTLNGERV